MPELDFSRVRQDSIFLAILLLHSHRFWHWYNHPARPSKQSLASASSSYLLRLFLQAYVVIEYLREYLHIPPEIVPATHRKAPRPQRDGPGGLRRREDGGAYRPPRREGGEGEYRRRDDGGERPRFGGGGFGRGRVAE